MFVEKVEKEEPLVSIILPIYNGGKYLKQTLDMILASDYRTIEVICIDDCSTDDSPIICSEVAACDRRVIYYRREKNGGVAEARNTGLTLAMGKYICFADQDDIIDCRFYDVLVRDIVASGADIAISNISHLINGKQVKQGTIKDSKTIKGRECKVLLKWLIYDEDSEDIIENKISKTVWNVLFSAELIRNNGIAFHRIVAYEDDFLFLLAAVDKAECIYLEKESLYSWRIHNTQTTLNPRYIVDFANKRKTLRKKISSYFEHLECSETEIRNYNANYISRVLYRGITNEVISLYTREAKTNDAVKKLKYLKKTLEVYINDVPKALIIKKSLKTYGIRGAFLNICMLQGSYRIPIWTKLFQLNLKKMLL